MPRYDREVGELHICTADDCPFSTCEHHMKQLSVAHTVAYFGPRYSMCRKYIGWIIDEMRMENEIYGK